MDEARLEAFLAIMQQQELDAIALVPGANFRRVFGKDFHQNERPLVVIAPAMGRRWLSFPISNWLRSQSSILRARFSPGGTKWGLRQPFWQRERPWVP